MVEDLIRPELRRLVEDLVMGEFDKIVADGRSGKLSADDMRRAPSDYPGHVSMPPDDAFQRFEVIEVTVAKEPTWYASRSRISMSSSLVPDAVRRANIASHESKGTCPHVWSGTLSTDAFLQVSIKRVPVQLLNWNPLDGHL